MDKPIPPPNRIIREGESICWTCGGGRASHRAGALGHPFEGRNFFRNPAFGVPLSLPATCLILGIIIGLFAGLVLSAVLRHAWN